MKKNRTIDNRKLLPCIDWLFFLMLLTVISAITLTLFYRQALASLSNPGTEEYSSDMKAYILEMQGLDSGYDFPYPVFFKLSALFYLFTSPELAVALAAMLLNTLAILLVKYYLNRLLLPIVRNHRDGSIPELLSGILISLSGSALFFISMLFPPKGIYLPGIRFRYIGVFSANPYHNATFLAARPFAVLTFFSFVNLLTIYESGVKTKRNPDGAPLGNYVPFSIFLLIATMTKPSFTIVLVGSAGLIMLYRLFRNRWKTFLPSLQLGLCFLPTFVDLLYQYRGVFVPADGEERGIGFCLGEVWKLYCDNIPLAIGIAIGFPLLTLVFHFRELKRDTLYRFSWQLYLMSLAMAFLLFEKGFRKVDFNFSWGYMYGIFFCHLGSLIVLLRTTLGMLGPAKPTVNTGGRKFLPFLALAAQWLAYLWHVACGISYFCDIFQGGTYY